MHNFKPALGIRDSNAIKDTPKARTAAFVPNSTHHNAKNNLSQ